MAGALAVLRRNSVLRWISSNALPLRTVGLCLACALAANFHHPAADAQGLKRINTHLANETIALSSGASTVEGFLNELSLKLPPGAVIDPALEAALRDGMSVQLPEIAVTRGSELEIVPMETQFEEAWHFGPAGLEIEQPGVDGLREVDYTLFFHDRQEVGRRSRTKTIRKMQPQRVIAWKQLTSDDGPSISEILEARMKPGPHIERPRRWREIRTMESSAYEPGPTSCGPWADGSTSCGYKAGYGVVAVDPEVIPYHTRLFIPGYGYAIAGDTGSAIRGDKIDLGFLTVDECYAWGRRDVQVYMLY